MDVGQGIAGPVAADVVIRLVQRAGAVLWRADQEALVAVVDEVGADVVTEAGAGLGKQCGAEGFCGVVKRVAGVEQLVALDEIGEHCIDGVDLRAEDGGKYDFFENSHQQKTVVQAEGVFVDLKLVGVEDGSVEFSFDGGAGDADLVGGQRNIAAGRTLVVATTAPAEDDGVPELACAFGGDDADDGTVFDGGDGGFVEEDFTLDAEVAEGFVDVLRELDAVGGPGGNVFAGDPVLEQVVDAVADDITNQVVAQDIVDGLGELSVGQEVDEDVDEAFGAVGRAACRAGAASDDEAAGIGGDASDDIDDAADVFGKGIAQVKAVADGEGSFQVRDMVEKFDIDDDGNAVLDGRVVVCATEDDFDVFVDFGVGFSDDGVRAAVSLAGEDDGQDGAVGVNTATLRIFGGGQASAQGELVADLGAGKAGVKKERIDFGEACGAVVGKIDLVVCRVFGVDGNGKAQVFDIGVIDGNHDVVGADIRERIVAGFDGDGGDTFGVGEGIGCAELDAGRCRGGNEFVANGSAGDGFVGAIDEFDFEF